MVYVSPPVVVVGLENPSFGVRGRFLAEAQVMSPAIFVSEASVFLGLATEKNHTPKTKKRTPEPPPANNNHHNNHGRRWQKCPPSANTPRRRVGKSAVGTL